MPAIVVLVKNVPDTWSTKSLTADFTLDREAADNVIDEINEFHWDIDEILSQR